MAGTKSKTKRPKKLRSKMGASEDAPASGRLGMYLIRARFSELCCLAWTLLKLLKLVVGPFTRGVQAKLRRVVPWLYRVF